MSLNNSIFLSLIRMGVGHRADALPPAVDWCVLKDLAVKHGLDAIVLDGVEKLPDGQKPPKIFLLEWIGETLQGYEYRYELYQRAIAELARFYNSRGYKMMVLKGYACSLDWPRPEHRPCGDIDIWLFGQQKKADKLLENEKGIEIDDGHEHHTVFYWGDFMVENHYDFINVYHRKSSPKLEKLFKELGKDDSHLVEVCGERVFMPSPNLSALFLLRHSMQHLVGAELTLRQLLDWAFFVEKHGKDVDWDWLMKVLNEFGMEPAFNIFNTICIEDLGFDANLFPMGEINKEIKKRVLNDILSPEFAGVTPAGLLPRVLFKYNRWKANGWKNELCFKESMWSAFWSSAWGHILKPSSI